MNNDSDLGPEKLPGLRYLSLGIYHLHQPARILSTCVPWPLLGPCSDGGGISGLSILTTLNEVMRRIQFDLEESGASANTGEVPLPCEYFDLIGGTSTGGYVHAYYIWSAHRIIEFEQLNCINAGSTSHVGG